LDRGGGGVTFVGQRTGEGLSEPEVSKRVQNDHSFMWRCRPRALSLAAANRGVSRGHPAWSGLSVVGVLRRVENQGVEQDVEFAHATRKGQQNLRPLMSTASDIAPYEGLFKASAEGGEAW